MYCNFSGNEYSKENNCCDCYNEIKQEKCCYYPSAWGEEDFGENGNNYKNKCHYHSEYKNNCCNWQSNEKNNWEENRDFSNNFYSKNNYSYNEEKFVKKEGCHSQKHNRKKCCFCSLFNCCRW